MVRPTEVDRFKINFTQFQPIGRNYYSEQVLARMLVDM